MVLDGSKTLNLKSQLNEMKGQLAVGSGFIGKLSFHVFYMIIVVSCSYLGGPAYKRPELPEKDTWHQTSVIQVSAAETIQPEWWKKFGDSYLDQLIQQSIQGGNDLKILAARLEAAGAGIDTAKSGALPRLNASESLQYQQSRSDNNSGNGSNDNDPGDQGSQRNSSDTTFSRSFSLNWEIDLWGRIRKGIKASKAEYKATEADWRAGYLTLVSSVANKYFEIRQFDEQIAQQQATLKNNEQLLEIYRSQFAEGLLAKSRLLSQQAEINSLNKELLELRRQRQVTEFNLGTLLGLPAGNLKVPHAPLTGTVKEIDVPVGMPSDLLSRRPDIIAQEYRVLAAHELVGQARLARLPSISLAGNVSSSGSAFSNLLKVGTFGIGPTIDIPIFDPNVKANIKSTSASAKIAEEEYKKTVITAFEEVETALTNLASRKKQKRQLEQQIENLSIVRDVQYAQLKEGLVSQLEVFDTDRTLLSAQQSLLQLHQQILTDTVTLYKAMGGGWSADNIGQAVP